MGEQHPLAQHPLVPSSKLDLRDGECVAEVQRAVHVRVGERSEPLGPLGLDLGRREACGLLWRRSVDLEKFFRLPAFLPSLFDILEVVSLRSLGRDLDIERAGRSGGHVPAQAQWAGQSGTLRVAEMTIDEQDSKV